MATLKAPVGLGKAGKAQWSAIAGAGTTYLLRPDEITVLEDVCRTADMIEALVVAWVKDGSPMTTKGSMGQQVIHPLIGEIRTQRSARAALLRQLKLPDGDEVPAANQHRDAANTKWSKRGA